MADLFSGPVNVVRGDCPERGGTNRAERPGLGERRGFAGAQRFAYRPYLDGVRGVAVLLVVLCHVFPGVFDSAGHLGVQIFFVLSGYLITALLITEYKRHGSLDLPRFYLRRALRLVPALLVTITIYVLMSVFVNPENVSVPVTVARVAFGLFYLVDFSNALGWGGATVLFHLWTLSVEEQFYLLWPLTLAALFAARNSAQRFVARMRGIFFWSVVFGLLYPLLAIHHWHGVNLYYLPITWAGSLVSGAMLAVMRTDRRGWINFVDSRRDFHLPSRSP